MSVARPGAPADPKVLLKGVKDAQARILKLQEENDQLRQRLGQIEKGGSQDPPAPAARSQPEQAPEKPTPRPAAATAATAATAAAHAAPAASIYAQTDVDDKSFLVLDFGGKKAAGGPGMRNNPLATTSAPLSVSPSMAPSTIMLQGQQQLRQQQQQQQLSSHPAEERPPSPTTTTATENSMRAFNNPAYTGNQQFTQQEASEWKQMYIETLKHLRATKEAIEKERHAAQQWEQELRTMQVVDGDSPVSSLPGSPSAGAASATHTAPSTILSAPLPPRSATAPPATTTTAAAAVTLSPALAPVKRTLSLALPSTAGKDGGEAARVAALRTQSETVPQEFLQKYQQLGLGPPAGTSPQQLPALPNTPNIYVLDPLEHPAGVQTKGPIVYDVRTGMTYTESPVVSKSKGSVRSAATMDSSSFTSVVSAKLDILGKPKRRIQHTVSRSMQSASKGKNAPPWMRNLFSCVNISDTATKM